MNVNVRILTLASILAWMFSQTALGQNNRLNTYNTIGWYNYLGTFKISKRLGIHTEYQWRRNNLITERQQSLLRVGVNYHLRPSVTFRMGYGWIETFPYGAYPINGWGREFTEHRMFEMVQLSHKEGIVVFLHRFMLEQRLVGRYSSANIRSEDEFPLLHRARYMARLQMPLKGQEVKDKTPYVAVYDEMMIGFGKNVNANVFDQNRIGVLFGYRLNKRTTIEGGYLNQTLQFGRPINGRNVFQYNQGLILNGIFNFDLARQGKK